MKRRKFNEKEKEEDKEEKKEDKELEVELDVRQLSKKERFLRSKRRPCTPEEALYFLGYDSFRDGQLEAIESILHGFNVLLVLPTGLGKSLVYQILSVLLDGVTIVVTPLISLMKDQIEKLPVPIRGACLNSNQTQEQQRQIVNALRNKRLDVLYITPERLQMWVLNSKDFPISLACIDEVHCVSCWSHNFRPTYMRLHFFFKQLNIQRVVGLTATATNRTLAGIADVLNMKYIVKLVGGEVVMEDLQESSKAKIKKAKGDGEEQGGELVEAKGGEGELVEIKGEKKEGELVEKGAALEGEFIEIKGEGEIQPEKEFPQVSRLNLNLSVTYCQEGEKMQFLTRLLQKDTRFSSGSILIYVWKKKTAQAVYTSITSRGVQARCYHGGLVPEERNEIQIAFMTNRFRVLVTTIAFGMGIDKQDIQGVIHYDLPKSLENFVQESGRCARDFSKQGHCHVLLTDKDYREQRKLVFGSVGSHGKAVKQLLDLLFAKRKHYVETEGFLEEDEVYAVFLHEKETARKLSCAEHEIHSLLAHLERISNNAFHLYSSFPSKLRLEFFGKAPEQIAEKDPFFNELLPLCSLFS